MPLPVIVGLAAGLLAAWTVYTYNFLVHARTKVREAMSGVDVQLKLRHDLVPNLNDVVRAYAEHENEAMRAAAARRCQAIAAQRTEDVEEMENALAAEMSNVLAVAENFPQLKASEKFIALAKQLTEIEDEIQGARELYNGNVEFYNSRAQSLPASIVAGFMNPRSFRYLKLEPVNFDADLTRMGEFAA
jgi:LemA protein